MLPLDSWRASGPLPATLLASYQAAQTGVMSESPDITTGLQCCLLCGRTITDRALHDSVEEQVLLTIRAVHPELAAENSTCQMCVAHYRNLLKSRAARADRRQANRRERRSHPFERLRRMLKT